MINTIIFDLGNVLIEFNWQRYLASFAFDSLIYEAIATAMFCSPYWNEFDRGALSDQEILTRFISEAPAHADKIAQVFENFPASLKCFSYSHAWLTGLKANGYQLYYLSNYAKTTHEHSKDELSFLSLMNGGMMSYEIQKIKPEPAIYHSFFEKYQIIPKNTVFIDDRKPNIEMAKTLGLHTVHFTDYQAAKQQLDFILNTY